MQNMLFAYDLKQLDAQTKAGPEMPVFPTPHTLENVDFCGKVKSEAFLDGFFFIEMHILSNVAMENVSSACCKLHLSENFKRKGVGRLFGKGLAEVGGCE